MPNGTEVEVIILNDDTMLFVRESGNFVTHFLNNNAL
jgi:hypothetical protein